MDRDEPPEGESVPPTGSETDAESKTAAGRNGSAALPSEGALDRADQRQAELDRAVAERDQTVAEADQAFSDSDQTAAEVDQTSSDSDQTSSERDEAQAEVDQLISNRDQASADRERDAHRGDGESDSAYETSRAERLAGTLVRNLTSEERIGTTADRLEQSAQRDEGARTRDLSADARDLAAAQRDRVADEMERELARGHTAVGAARDQAAAVRARAASNRARAASDREQAAADRASAAEERALARAELKHAQAHANQVVGQLADGVAHNFNNLLSIVLLYAHQLIPRARESTERRDIEEIIVAANRGAELTRQLLRFAGLGKTGGSPVEPSEAIRELEPALRRLLGSDIGIDLQIEPRGHPAMVEVDPAEFDHIIMNLVLNARDAMPGGGTITVASTSRTLAPQDAAEHGVEPGEYSSLTVSDTGVGIHEDVLGRIFEPFFTTKSPGRVGLGLATVYGAVGQAGGWVDVQTEVGSGTTFHVTLPTTTTTTTTTQADRPSGVAQ